MTSLLHNHCMYSIKDGYSTPKEMLDKAQELKLKAFAITDHGNAFSWCYFDKIKQNYPDIKMIYGVEAYEAFDMYDKDKDNKYFHLVLLAKNENGRKALNEIITTSELEGKYYKPRVDLNLLRPHSKNLIVLSACLASKLSRESDFNKCIDYVNEYKSIFPYFYLEMQSHKSESQALYNQKILQLSKVTNTPFTITTDSHAHTKETLDFQDIHVAVGRKAQKQKDGSQIDKDETYEGCYMQSDEEIHNIMDKQIGEENVTLGLKVSDEIVDLVDIVDMPFQKPQLPTFPLPQGFNSNKEYLEYLTKEIGWKHRKYDDRSPQEIQERKDRLEYELGVIDTMGFNGYFLIVWDYINFCLKNGYPVGKGRGSAAGSEVCYLLGISDLDPIDYGLIFERFLNIERISMPDIDQDFADRDKVIEYLMNKYGYMNVCQVINFVSYTPVTAIKAVGGILLGEDNKLMFNANQIATVAKLFTERNFDECIEKNQSDFNKYLKNENYQLLFKYAKALTDRISHTSVHAGGVGIVDTTMNDYMPMKLGDKGEHIIQVDKHLIEEIGIIKFDILGLPTLSIIENVKKRVGLTDWELDANNPQFLHDTKMYELLCKAQTNSVFQLESQGMKDLLLRLQPNSLEDISAVLALYRPDSMQYLEDYIYYKHHPSEIKYIHEDMRPILETTNGQMIYQEELMEIVKVFGGRTLGGADLFRKAIGKILPM